MNFIGRKDELKLVKMWDKSHSRLTVLYGRRRVGKTRLVEEASKNKRVYKFEGMEGRVQKQQRKSFLLQLAAQFNAPELGEMNPQSWNGLLLLLSKYVGKKPCIIFFDEFQWMAGNRNELISCLKYAWDNFYTKNNRVHLILCGSITSFMVKNVVRSKALYGRVDNEIHLRPLSLDAITKVLKPKRSLKELVEMYMAFGGIPQYLKMMDFSKSVLLNFQDLCFSANGYFVNELDRIMISHFGKNRAYKKIIMYLAKNKWGNREQIKKECRLESGGRFTEYMENLELAEFVEKYVSVDRPESIRNARYRISDPYLLFYFSFIHPFQKKINQTEETLPISYFLPDKRYLPWKGIAFEKVCLRHHRLIADKLGFKAVQYEAGSWYGKGQKNEKAQIDMLFIRADHVITLCEIKYTETKPDMNIIKDMKKKIEIFPNPKKQTIEKVLLTAAPPTKALVKEGFFNRILTIEDILG